jgi:glycosyltransferase involved in cell wall biosynthesis
MVGGTRPYEMAKRLAAAGHEVHVIAAGTAQGARGWTTEELAGFTVHWFALDYDNKMSNARRIRVFARFAMTASARARRLRGDVVFASSTPLTVALPGIFATLANKTPLVFEVRDLWPEIPIAIGALKSRVTIGAARALERHTYRRSHAVVALSPGMAEGVRRVHDTTVYVIPNASDIDLFDVPRTAGLAFRSARSWLGDGPLVVYAGTFGKVNGLSYMVQLARLVYSIDRDVRFLAVGAGQEEPVLRRKAEDLGILDVNFFLEPPIPKADVPSLLSAADICTSWVIPLQELEANSANKFFDSLAAGRPVAINHGGWQKDLIEKTGIGIVLDPVPSADSAAKLVNFLRNRQGLDVAGRNALQLAKREFSRDLLADRLRCVLEGAVAESHRNHRI